MTHSYVCHDSSLSVTRLIHVCNMTHWHLVMWLILVYDMSLTISSRINNLVKTSTTKKDKGKKIPCQTWLIRMSSLIFTCGMTHSYAIYESFIWVTWLVHMCVIWLIHTCDMTWLIHMCDMTHSYVWRDSFVCVKWPFCMCEIAYSYVWHDWFICTTWLIHICDMMHSCVWHKSFICVTWLMHMCDVTHSYMWYDLFICATWRIHGCDMTQSYLWLCCMCHCTHILVTCIQIHVCDMTDSYVWHDSFIHVTLLHVSCHRYTHSCHMNIHACYTYIHSCHMFIHSYIWNDPFICSQVYTNQSRHTDATLGGARWTILHCIYIHFLKWPIHMLWSLYERVTHVTHIYIHI